MCGLGGRQHIYKNSLIKTVENSKGSNEFTGNREELCTELVMSAKRKMTTGERERRFHPIRVANALSTLKVPTRLNLSIFRLRNGCHSFLYILSAEKGDKILSLM